MERAGPSSHRAVCGSPGRCVRGDLVGFVLVGIMSVDIAEAHDQAEWRGFVDYTTMVHTATPYGPDPFSYRRDQTFVHCHCVCVCALARAHARRPALCPLPFHCWQ